MHINFSQVLLVGGNSRKSGKTAFICHVIEKFAGNKPLAAFKIALYTALRDLQDHYPLKNHQDFYEVRENEASGDRDSALYIKAGADTGWFIAAMDTKKSAERIFERMNLLIAKGYLLIIESNRLRDYLKPGLFVMVNQKERADKARTKHFQQMSDLIIKSDSEAFKEPQQYISIEGDSWMLKNPKT